MQTPSHPARLRGHHLMCLNFFHGGGYSAEFVVNLMRTLETWEERPVLVVDGPDDICGACPSTVDEAKCILVHEHGQGVRELDQLALELLDAAPGDTVRYADIRGKVPRVIHEWRERACSGCDWEPTCRSSLDLVERLP